MRVLFGHHSILPDGFVHMGLSVLSAVLKQAGHKVRLFDTFFCENKDKLKKLSPLFKKVKNYNPKKNIFLAYTNLLKQYKPDVVGFTATENEMPMIKRLINMTDSYIILGGPYATTIPEKAIKIRKIDALCIGEGEDAFLELLKDLNRTDIKNMWFKKAGVIYKNPLRPLKDLDQLPFMDYSIYKKEIFKKSFMGKEYIQGQTEMTRGCPYSCAYCINSYLHKLYKGLGPFFRRKSIKRIIKELLFLKKKHHIEFLRFGDENFLGQPINALKEYAKEYKKVNIPFTIATRPETITEEKLNILKTMPCKQVTLGLEHGNEEFRKKVLNRHCTNKDIIKAYRLLKKHKIRCGAYLMIGFPTETEKLINDTFNLALKVKPDIVAVYFFRPYEKTPLYDMCKRHNLLKNINANYFSNSMVKGIPFKKLKKMRDDFYERFKNSK